MKNCTKLFLWGLLSLVLSMMPAKSWAVERLTYDLEYCDSCSIAGANYLATLDDGTVLGFSFVTTNQYDENGDYVLDENGDYVYDVWALFTGAITETTSLVVPDSVRVDNETYLVISCGYPTEVDFEEAPNVTSLTVPGSLWWIRDIPSTVNELHIGWGGIPDLGESVDLSSVSVYVLTSYYDSFMYRCQEGLGGWSTDYTIIAEGGDDDYNPEEWGYYTIDVPSPGQLSHLLLNKIDQWTDVKSLTLTGSLNADDLALLSRLTEMYTLDLSQTDITIMTGCRGLSNLSMVILPSTVTKIDEYAFYLCTSLSSISLPNVEEVGDYAFYGTALESVELPQAKLIGKYAFAAGTNYSNYYERGSSYLSYLEMPMVTMISEGAFHGCINLVVVIMPNVEFIGTAAFANCPYLNEINLPQIEELGSYAFYIDSRLDHLEATLSKIVVSDKLRNIPSYCFSGCTALTQFEFPSRLETIGTYAFYDTGLSSISLPESLLSIGYYAFRGCPLTELAIPSTVNEIESSAFTTSNITDLYSYVVQPFSTSAFSGMTSATLHVPAFSLNAYRLHDDWYHFASIVPIEEDLEKLYFNRDFSIYDYKGLADKVDMTLAYGSEYVNSWTSNITPAHVTVNANSALTLGEYVQYQDWYNRKSNYDDDSDQYIYTYPYCTSLITQNEITADKMCTNVYMRDGRWNFISFPYDVNVSDIVVPEGVLWVIRKYSGADRAAMTGNTWQNMTDGMVLKAGEGYIFHCYNEEDDEVCVSFPSASNDAGTLFAYEDVVKTLSEYPSEYAHNRSWNLVGNPYPSYFNTQEIEFDAPITVWNGDGYTAYSLLDDSYVLTPNEAFFVQRPINAASMTFHKEGRMHELETTSEDYAPSFTRTRNASTSRFVYNFLLADGSYTDRARLVVNEEAKIEYEVNCDASKFMSSNADVPQLYINDGGVKYAIDERPLGNGVINLGAYFGKAGEHTISLASNPNEKVAVMLTDRLTGTVANLSMDSYTFTAETGTSDDRFIIVLESTTDIENGMADEAPITEVYTLDGKQVADTDNLPAGVYLVKKGSEYVKHVVKE